MRLRVVISPSSISRSFSDTVLSIIDLVEGRTISIILMRTTYRYGFLLHPHSCRICEIRGVETHVDFQKRGLKFFAPEL